MINIFFLNNSDIPAIVKCIIPIKSCQTFGDTVAYQAHKVNCQISQEKTVGSIVYSII